jgi:TetR/AcrR family transcriptional regulator, cholesterol catabolism regulator
MAETKTGASRADGRRRSRSKEAYEERRQEIIDTAAQLFAQRGYHATSIDDLVTATGLQRGGLYHYIDGKQDLLIRIHERFIEPLLENARAIAALGEEPETELRLLAHALLQDIADYRDQVTVFMNEWRIIEHAPEWKAIRKARREFENIIVSCIRRGKADGVFREVDEQITMRGFLGLINYTYQWFNPTGRLPSASVADAFAEIFLRGILTKP